MNQNRSLRRIGSVLLSTAVLLMVVYSVPALSASAEQTASNGLTLEENKAKADELEDAIQDLKDQNADIEQMRKAVNEQISNTEERIALVTTKLIQINTELKKAQKELDQRESDLEDSKNAFKQRLRALYMSSGIDSDLLILLSSDDMADYLAKAELTRSVSEYDAALIDEIVTAMADIQDTVDEIASKKSDQEAAKQDLAETQTELNTQEQELSNLIDSNNDTIEDKETELAVYQQAADALEAEISRASQSSSVNITYSGQFTWPCPGYYNITSGFKWRWGRQHKGIDISSSGITGKPVVAAADGVVSLASYNDGGYGNYVMINHGTGSDGNSYVTLYGHMQSYCVSAGQSVTKGQTIGYVGNTGYSTGPHLHFEIRVNGTAVDPTSYFN